MHLKTLLNVVLLVVLCAGLGTGGPAAAQGVARVIPIPGALLTVKTSPDGRLAAVYEVSQFHDPEDLVPDYLPVRLVDLETEGITPLSGPADYALDVAFSPDGATLAGCYGSGQIVLWDTASGAEIRTLFSLPGLQRCAFLADDQTLAVVAPTLMLSAFLVLDTDSGAITRVLSHRFDTYAQVREVNSGPANFGPYALAAFAVSPDGSQIVTSSMNDSLWTWDVAGAPPALLFESGVEMPNLSIRKLAFTADGMTLVYLHQTEPAIHAWDLASATETTVIPLEERPFDFALAPDGDRVVLIYRGGSGPVLVRLSQPDSAPTPIDVTVAGAPSAGAPVVAFATPVRIVVAGLLAEDTGQNALIVIDLPDAP